MSMKSKRSLEGYLLVDNRHAPGPSIAEIARFERLHGPVAGAGASFFESATLTCAHCHAQIVLNPDRSRARNYCSKCDKYVCDHPSCVVECRPLTVLMDHLHSSSR